ncbi:MAG: AI-2E family transporter [Steroidobacteraceae bacterium]|nr:AI-2E family transporter [Steroidobacteraceae bacterium]
MTDDSLATPLIRRLTLVFFLGGLLLLAWAVLRPFLVPVLWAGILAFVTWPLFQRLHRAVRSVTLASLIMTLLVGVLIIGPLVWLVFSLRVEVVSGYQSVLAKWAAGQIHLPPAILNLPIVGPEIRAFLERIAANPDLLGGEIGRLLERSVGEMSSVIGGVGRNVAKLALALLSLFFLYRSGELVLAQSRTVLRGILGERVDGYLEAVGATTRAVVYGIVLTALVQGAFAGIGYWAVGLDAPIFLGAVTALIAFIPFGTPFVWITLSLWLLAMDRTGAAIGLFLYGALVISWVDNLVRPMVISSATRIPFLLVMFGVLGGVAAFGLIGLFIGPVILAVLMAVWREWLEEHEVGPLVSEAKGHPPTR